MSKKHFNLLAAAMLSCKPIPEDGKAQMTRWVAACEKVADVCRGVNDLFDRRRFLQACGVD
jgi:hypothetical protein